MKLLWLEHWRGGLSSNDEVIRNLDGDARCDFGMRFIRNAAAGTASAGSVGFYAAYFCKYRNTKSNERDCQHECR